MKKLFYLFFLVIALSSCKDFFEDDLSDNSIQINMPSNGFSTNNYSIQFWWDSLSSATSYSLQILDTSFSKSTKVIKDTTIKTTKLTITLSPGIYEWRIKANNGNSSTFWQYSTLYIATGSLSNQTVVLNNPIDLSASSSNIFNLNWQSLYGASKYVIQIDTTPFDFVNCFKIDSTLNTTYQFIPSLERSYQWRVMAKNSSQSSNYSTMFTFKYDKTAPAKLSNLTPSNNTNFSNPVLFNWTGNSDCAKYDIWVSIGDSNSVASGYPISTTSTSYQATVGTTGNVIYWRVRGVDAANNNGAWTNFQKLTIN